MQDKMKTTLEYPNVCRLPGNSVGHNEMAAVYVVAAGLASELEKANLMIVAVLGAMSNAQKLKVAQQLDAQGVSPDGMTRYQERQTELRRHEEFVQKSPIQRQPI